MSGLDGILISIVPSIGVGLLFWYVMRAVIRADRRERAELAKIEAEEDARDAIEAQSNAGSDATSDAQTDAHSAAHSAGPGNADAPKTRAQ